MKTVEIKLYQYSELSDEAKKKAIENRRDGNADYFDGSDNRTSMESFAKTFPINIRDWSYCEHAFDIRFSFTADDEIRELSGVRLATYIWNNYKNDLYTPVVYRKNGKNRVSRIQIEQDGYALSGWHMDYPLLKPIWDFLERPYNINFYDLMEECLNAWGRACSNDMEYQNSDECIKEAIEANEYEFTEDGEIY